MADYAHPVPTAPQAQPMHPPEYEDGRVNVGEMERLLSVIGGGALVLYGLRRSLGHLALILGGSALVYRGLTGHCKVYQRLGVNTAETNTTPDGVSLEATITVHKPVAEVYDFWRHLENHPRFVTYLQSVQNLGETRSHWIAEGPLRSRMEWDAEIVEERQNALLAWRSLPGADLENTGTVRFRALPNQRGTEVWVRMQYAPPGGSAGAALGRLMQSFTERQLQEDLRRFKQILEAGEVATTAQQSSGRSSSH